MQFTLATLALAAAGLVSAQGVSQTIKPSGAAPAGCSADYPSKFEITVVLPSKKRDIVQRQSACASDGTLVATLKNSVLTDAKGRIGAIVANRQFQFDGPPSQAGSIYSGGFSVCSNGSLALGPSAVFYECLSGTFYNIYDRPAGASCIPVLIQVLPCGGAGASQGGDGQPTAASATKAATQIGDGQVQATSARPKATQIGDGQVQASSAGPKATQIGDGQVQASSAGPKATQIGDGQVQASSAGPKASQIGDGQVQASSAAPKPVSQFSDGQIQVTATPSKPAVVSQISDGQVQATATKPAVVSQASEGQVQASSAAAPKSSAAPAPQASTLSTVASTAAASPVATVTGSGASMISVGATLMAAAVAAVAVFLL